MYQLNNDTVTLSMTVNQYEMLLVALGYAISKANQDDTDLFPIWLSLTNALNEGNPNFTPYEAPPPREIEVERPAQ